MAEGDEEKGIDVLGFGKIAKAIPPKVYQQTAATLLTTFQQITAPITATTEGLGRYLRQKFENMVDAEKAIATYTIQKAVERARGRSSARHDSLHAPVYPKQFVRAIEEASKETDPLLHEMWSNLLASQLADDVSHPHFVEALTHFSPAEAQLLVSLVSKSEIGENGGGYFYATYDDAFQFWMAKANSEPKPWTISCTILCQLHLADIMAPKDSAQRKSTTILYRSATGTAFLAAVSPQASE